jgi:outer membrane autotransporter protein
VNGGFSTDLTYKGDFLVFGESTIPSSFRVANHVVAWNVSYKDEMGSWWFEPTAGISHTNTIWNDTAHTAGLSDGRSTRLQAGVRFGGSYDAGSGVTVEPSLAMLLYDDVSIEGGTLATVLAPVPQAPTDAGKIFGQAIGKLNFDFGSGFSAYTEGEIRGRESVIGLAARVGVRKTFQ